MAYMAKFYVAIFTVLFCSGVYAGTDDLEIEFVVVEAPATLEYLPRQYELRVLEQGYNYVVEPDDLEMWYQDAYHKSVHTITDLDDDNIPEAIIQTHNGGNCCSPSYFVIKRHEVGSYSILSNSKLDDAKHLRVQESPTGEVIVTKHSSYGVDNTKLDETISYIALKNGKLQVLSKATNDAYIQSLVEMTSEELKTLDRKSVSLDLDGDNKLDELSCSYWPRWGDINCSVISTVHGSVRLEHSCKRVGVIAKQHNGMNELVCNLSQVMRFDPSKRLFVDHNLRVN